MWCVWLCVLFPCIMCLKMCAVSVWHDWKCVLFLCGMLGYVLCFCVYMCICGVFDHVYCLCVYGLCGVFGHVYCLCVWSCVLLLCVWCV